MDVKDTILSKTYCSSNWSNIQWSVRFWMECLGKVHRRKLVWIREIYYINLKEMRDVEFILECYSRKSQVIRLYINNTCVVSILKNMCPLHKNELNEKCKNIWKWCIQKDIWLTPACVKSSKIKADQPSRKIYS